MTLILEDGHPTTIKFHLEPTLLIKEVSVTPPGVDGGGENDVTTMRNVAWRTRAPKKLKTLTPGSCTVQYDPAAIDDIMTMVNVNQKIDNVFSDGDTLQFWGWLNSFEPNEHVEGEPPTADIEIIPSNRNNAGVEVAPVRIPSGATTTTGA